MSFANTALSATGNRNNSMTLRPINPVMGTRIIDRLNLFYAPSSHDGYSHRVLRKPMEPISNLVFKELKGWAPANVRQMLATACFNCGITYRNPFTHEEKLISSYEELSNAFIQNRDSDVFSKYIYAFNHYVKINRDWLSKLEARFMDDFNLQYSTLRSESPGNMTDIGYYLTHLKHSTISNLHTKLKKSVSAEESLLRGGSVVLYIITYVYYYFYCMRHLIHLSLFCYRLMLFLVGILMHHKNECFLV